MTALPPPGDAPRAAAALLLAAVLVVWGLGLTGLWQAADLAESEREAGLERLAVLERRIAQAAPPADPGRPEGDGSPYLDGETPALAGNGLQQRILRTIEQNGGQVMRFQNRPPEELPDQEFRLEVEVSFEVGLVGLQAILFALETGVPALFIKTLSAEGIDPAPSAAPVSAGERLRVLLGASGYWHRHP
jgi:hypothetical protein